MHTETKPEHGQEFRFGQSRSEVHCRHPTYRKYCRASTTDDREQSDGRKLIGNIIRQHNVQRIIRMSHNLDNPKLISPETIINSGLTLFNRKSKLSTRNFERKMEKEWKVLSKNSRWEAHCSNDRLASCSVNARGCTCIRPSKGTTTKADNHFAEFGTFMRIHSSTKLHGCGA